MSEFTRNIRKQMSEDSTKENPLDIIGVSPQILSLGLTEDELYDYITRDVARRLVMRFHPDRLGEIDPEAVLLQRKYSEVYENLLDRAVFNKALSDFRSLKSEERSEVKSLRNRVEDVNRLLKFYQDKELSLEQGTRKLSRDRLEFENEESSLRLNLSSLETSLKVSKDNMRVYRSLAIVRQKRYEDILRFISWFPEEGSLNTPHPFDAKWVIFASLVPNTPSDVPLAVKFGEWSSDFLQSIEHLQIPETVLSDILSRWNKGFKKFNTPEVREKKNYYDLRLSVAELSRGRSKVIYGWTNSVHKHDRLIGSIPSFELEIGRRELTHMTSRDFMFKTIMPFIYPGGLLVSIRLWKGFDEKKKDKLSVSFRRETRRVILGAG